MDLPAATVLATYTTIKTDQCDEEEISPHHAAIMSGRLGAGHLVVFGPHPEASGSTWLAALVNAIKWAARRSSEQTSSGGGVAVAAAADSVKDTTAV